jgi:AraC family transcriptional regulator
MPAAASSPSAERAYRPLQRDSGLRLTRCQCRAGRHARPVDEQHQAFSVTLVERGVFTYRSPSGQAVLSPGWLMLANDGEGYTCSHEHNDGQGDDCAVLGISAQRMDELQSALGQRHAGTVFRRASLPPMPRVAALLKTLLADGDEGFALEETALAVVGAVQRTLNDESAPSPAAAQSERALAAARHIESHATEPLSLDEVAAAVGLGSFHLMRTFRHSMGVTPHQYLIRLRLLRAVELLRDSALPVTSVAYEAGWADLSNFIRTFQREIGCSPRDFRRSDRKMLGARTPAPSSR